MAKLFIMEVDKEYGTPFAGDGYESMHIEKSCPDSNIPNIGDEILSYLKENNTSYFVVTGKNMILCDDIDEIVFEIIVEKK